MQDIKYAPSGNHFFSVGSDAKIFLYDGKEGETLGDFSDSPHSGTVVSSFVHVHQVEHSFISRLL